MGRIIEKGTALNNMNKGSRKKTPQQFHIIINKQQPVTSRVNLKSPKINISPQNEHQEIHPTPHGKRGQIKGVRFKDNIDNITKQMLAGSHAGRIAKQLHDINRRTTLDVNQSKAIKINKVNQNNKLG